MRSKRFIWFLLIPALTASYIMSYTQVRDLRSRAARKERATPPFLPPVIMQAIAGEFKGLAADFLLLEAAAFLGGRWETTPEDWDAVHALLAQSQALDPYFKQTYYYVQTFLVWEAKKYRKALELLEIAKKHRPWDWYPGYFIGFDYFYFLKENLKASHALIEASRIPGAPPLLATLGARLAQKAGQTRTAIAFLQTMYAETEDDNTRKILSLRIKALKGVLILETGIDQFKGMFGRPPKKLEELVTVGILEKLPKNPYQTPYTYENGEIGF